ncbi:Flp pilus assembly complex ATPase component TadA [Tumebacillus sp. ITR2]|uniref:Flp pilus assembly complex ATPase component TadA n=1 Tax=Tumebacillus amylolyticus TaxID=2801339 RepID=A0ABS1J9X2_9BACL|nr:GspE/PulE family protein [Tumebacillus amylolyticus]MBL0387072.1 Flp pilus assembly complex ATPase component TadA [Tumebacillus amylolyticus]
MIRKRIGDLLIDAGLITEQQLQEALNIQKTGKEKLGDVFLNMGLLTEQQLIEALEFQLGIPHVQLHRYKVDQSLLGIIPERLANMYRVLPLKKDGNKLMVAMVDPLDYYAIDDLRMSTGFVIEPAIASKDEIMRAISRYYGMQGSVEEVMQTMQPQVDLDVDREIIDEDSPVVRMVNQIIQQAVQQRASDIHIDPQADTIRVRYRVDGVLRTERSLPKHMHGVITARMKILAQLNIAERRVPQDGRFHMDVELRTVDVRVSTLPTAHGEKIVMRVLDVKTAVNDIEKLGFEPYNLERFLTMLRHAHGIVLITGPTGSGKTSTLYAALNRMNTDEVNIVTVEDPVEYQVDGINQVQVNHAAGLTFASGLRAILRQDPNVIMVGEIRDSDTAEIAVRAALTGHLVFSTLHTNDAVASITRLIDMGIEPFLVSSSIVGVVGQRLVRRVCHECSSPYVPHEDELRMLEARGLPVDHLRIGRGCGNCNRTGYRGRVAIQEIMRMDEKLRRLIMEKRPDSEYRQHCIQNGMKTMFDDGLSKVANGITTFAEVFRTTMTEGETSA